MKAEMRYIEGQNSISSMRFDPRTGKVHLDPSFSEHKCGGSGLEKPADYNFGLKMVGRNSGTAEESLCTSSLVNISAVFSRVPPIVSCDITVSPATSWTKSSTLGPALVHKANGI